MSKHNDHKDNIALGMSNVESQKSMLYGVDYRELGAMPVYPTADYGADPLGEIDGEFRWRMHPSGDIVNAAERERRLKPLNKGRRI